MSTKTFGTLSSRVIEVPHRWWAAGCGRMGMPMSWRGTSEPESRLHQALAKLFRAVTTDPVILNFHHGHWGALIFSVERQD